MPSRRNSQRPWADVVPDDASADGAWKRLSTPDDLVEFYDPTDVFGDLAESLAEAYPQIVADDELDEDEEATDVTDEPHASPR